MLLNKSISINSATTTIIIPASSGQQVYVKRLVLESDASATHTIQIQDTAGGNKTGANRANIKTAGQPGTYAAGKPDSTSGTVLVSAVIQNKTDAMVIGQLAVPAKGQQGTAVDADNFLPSTVTAGAGTGYETIAANAAQAASSEKSLSPQQQ